MKIYHVISFSNSNERLKKVQNITIQSICNAYRENVVLICATRDSFNNPLFEHVNLNRDASTVLKDKRSLPFLSDIMDAAANNALDNDWLLYTNSDCIISPDLYRTLLINKNEFVRYHRVDVDKSIESLEKVFSINNELCILGIDGIAIKKKLYLQTKKYWENYVIGEANWDSTISLAYKNLGHFEKNTYQLYHIKHEQNWKQETKEMSIAGKHNESVKNSLKLHLASNTINPTKWTPYNYLVQTQKCADTIIVLTHGTDNEDTQITRKSIDNIIEFFDSNPNICLIEQVVNNQSQFVDLPDRVRHIKFDFDTMCTKQALMEKGIEFIKSDYKYLICCNNDITFTRSNCLLEDRQNLIFSPDKCICKNNYVAMSSEYFDRLYLNKLAVKQKILIFTLYNSSYVCGPYAADNHKKYADRNGYNYISIVDKPHEKTCYNNASKMAWSKIKYIIDFLPDYDWILWIDADAIFTNFNIKLEDIIKDFQNKNLIFDCINKINDDVSLNSGIFMCKNHPITFEFLNEVWNTDDSGPDKDGNFQYEQGAIKEILLRKWDYYNKSFGQCHHLNKFDKQSPYLYKEWHYGDFLVHAVACGNPSNRLNILKSYDDKIAGYSAYIN